MTLPHRDLVESLNNFGVTLADGTVKHFLKEVNLFSSPLRAAFADGKRTVPSLCVFINAASGGQPANASGQGGRALRRYVVSVTVRSESGSDSDLEDGELISEELWQQIHRNPPSGYAQCVATESQYQWNGQDDRGAHELVFNVELQRKL